LPIAGIPQQVSLLQNLTVDHFGNITTQEPVDPGTKYTAICAWPMFALEQMRQAKSFADSDDAYLQRYLTLPANQSDRVLDLSAQLCEGGSNRFVQAENIVSYLRKNCKYTSNRYRPARRRIWLTNSCSRPKPATASRMRLRLSSSAAHPAFRRGSSRDFCPATRTL